MKKVVILDFDGTMTKVPKGTNCWRKIWEKIDDLEYDDYLYGLFLRGEIDDETWTNLIIERYKQKGVTPKTLALIAKELPLLSGVESTLKKLHAQDVKIFVLSGGIKNIITSVLGKAQKYITSIEAYTLIFDSANNLVTYEKPTHNLEDKSEFVEFVKEKYALEARDILFVGNNHNDESVCKSGVDTLCVNPASTNHLNKAIWTNHIEKCDNFEQILPFLG